MEAFSDSTSGNLDAVFPLNYRYLKALILMTYFTSEKGVKQNLDYVVIPGEYNGSMDLPADGKVMVGKPYLWFHGYKTGGKSLI